MMREKAQNRTERLFNIILLLQNRPHLSSRDLADHFGVSRRTVFGDLRALSESGVPLTYADDGGYEILEGYQLPPLMLTAREAAVILIGTEFMRVQSDRSLQEDAAKVRLKIRGILPGEIREYVDRLQDRTVLDPYWAHAMRADEQEEGHWFRLSEALARQHSVAMQYLVQSRSELTQRTIDPLGLVYYTDHWNVIAFDHLRKDVRSFRMDHIQRMQVLSQRFVWPEGFDLEAYLKERGSPTDSVQVRLRFPEARYASARTRIPATILKEERRDGFVDVDFAFENVDYLAAWVLRFGVDATVVSPPEVRSRVRELAELIARRHG